MGTCGSSIACHEVQISRFQSASVKLSELDMIKSMGLMGHSWAFFHLSHYADFKIPKAVSAACCPENG